MFSVEQVLHKHYPKLSQKPLVFKTLSFVLRRLLHEREIVEFGQEYPHLRGLDFVEQVLDYFKISYSARDNERERIPTEGRVVIIANHPIGSLDGLALIKLIASIRSDFKVVANEMLMAIDPLKDILLPVNNMQGGTPKQHLQAIHQHLKADGAVLIFPAGEVSRLRPQGVRDTKWHTGFIRIARATQAPILPMFIDAKNSPLFYGMSMLYKPLATALLVTEMFKQKRNHLPIRIGEIIPFESFSRLSISTNDLANLFKKHLYRLPTEKSALLTTQTSIAQPEEKKQLSIALKTQCELLGETKDNKQIYLYEHNGSSTIMREIGRLREFAFRAVGEGTNTRRDVDKYDAHYFHLILWDEQELEIVGAYRFGDAKKLTVPNHPTGLYSETLFEYPLAANETLFAQGLELGRSFVQPKYWGKRSLDYLWFGIGAFLKRHPEYRYLFGPVSLSNTYPAAAKDLIIQFYKTHFPAFIGSVEARTPYVPETKEATHFGHEDYKTEFAKLKHMLANMGVNVPTLYKQYTEVCKADGVGFLDFNIDADFGDCIDGLIVVDLYQLKEKKRERYLG